MSYLSRFRAFASNSQVALAAVTQHSSTGLQSQRLFIKKYSTIDPNVVTKHVVKQQFTEYGTYLYKPVVQREIKKRAKLFSTSMFSRKDAQGNPIKMSLFEKLYWGVGVTGLSFLLFSTASPLPETKDPKKEKESEEARARAAQELQNRKIEFMRAYIAGKSFLEDDSPFEGMTPKEILAFVQESGLRADSDDPFEGMSPEEIDEYARLHGLS